MIYVLRPTKNGWIVTDDVGFMSTDDISNCHVFGSIKEVAEHLLSESGENSKSWERPRDSRGHFLKTNNEHEANHRT